MRLITLSLLILTGCTLQDDSIDPQVFYIPSQNSIKHHTPTFPQLSTQEQQTPWGQELHIGQLFAQEFDPYRSITALKRSLFLLPPNHPRQQQIDFSIALNYYLGRQFYQAIETFENSSIQNVSQHFPAYQPLLILLYESYQKTHQTHKASTILEHIYQLDPLQAQKLQIGTTIELGDTHTLTQLAPHTPQLPTQNFLNTYHKHKKNPKTAQILNAIIPGAGYLYVEQPKTALTAFILNSLFIATTTHLFRIGQPLPALFTLSLELGWYLGGINGAGICAKQYNETLYSTCAKEFMLSHRLFPILQLNSSF